jgi:hypothetical protein
MNSKQIAETILEQIKATDRAALMAWGAKNLCALETKQIADQVQLGGLRMSVNGLKFKGTVIVRLMASDTYTIEIGKVNMSKKSINFGEWICKGKMEEIYCEELMNAIDAMIER